MNLLILSLILLVISMLSKHKILGIGSLILSILFLINSFVNYDLPKELYDKTQLKEIFIKQHLGNQKLIKSFYGKLSDGVEVMWFFTLETRFTNQGQGCISIMGKGSSEILKVDCGNLEGKINGKGATNSRIFRIVQKLLIFIERYQRGGFGHLVVVYTFV